jgi:hypothetical protein
VNLENEEGYAPSVKRSNSSLLEEALYSMDVLAGGPRSNAHKENVARRARLWC